MNRNAPYIDVSNELLINVGAMIVILEKLSITKRSTYVLTFEKLQIFFFLINRPNILRRILKIAMKPEVLLREEEFYTVNAVSFNVDDLFDRDRVRYLIKYVSSKGFLNCHYTDSTGFSFYLSDSGIEHSKLLSEDYFQDLRKYADSMKSIMSLSTGKLNGYLNLIFSEEN